MTRIPRIALLATILSVALHVPCSAQDWARKMFETTSHDFGAVAHGATVEYRFKLTNTYQEPVHIAAVRSSCGCTMPRVVKDVLTTYEEGAIVAAFNTRAFNGQKSATITVTFDRPFYAEIQLQVAGFIRTDVSLAPGGIEFGSVDHLNSGSEAKSIEKKLIVTYAGRDDWKIVDVRPSSPNITATVRELGRATGNVTYELSVVLLPGAPVGSLKEQVILVTNHSQVTEVAVDVEARIVSAVTVSPGSLFFGAIQPGKKVTKQLVVQGKRPFKITRIHSDDPSFTFHTAEATKTVHLVPVTFQATDTPGKVSRKIHIETDLGADGQTDLSAFAQILEVPQN